jgi:hypothetical protein
MWKENNFQITTPIKTKNKLQELGIHTFSLKVSEKHILENILIVLRWRKHKTIQQI